MKILVLLSTYNGEKYLRELLESLKAQTVDNLEILVRDDDSSDGTKEILEEYSKQGSLSWYEGKNLGATKSFWHLLQHCGDADYYAFCDQDDVWDRDKLEAAVKMLEKEAKEQPILYCSDVRVVDENLEVMSETMVVPTPMDYPHALVRNVAPGCTYVMNRAAKELLCQYDAQVHGMELHDWFTYQVTACFGKVIYDATTHLSYRQHQENEIGDIRNQRKRWLGKLKSFWSGPMKNSREKNALRLETVYGAQMTPKAKEITAIFAHYREEKSYRKALRNRKEFQLSGVESVFFKLLILFRRL